MARRLNLLLPMALAAAALAASAGAAPDPATGAAPKPKPGRDCFLVNSWEGWSAPAGGDMLYLKVNLHDIYQVDLTPGSHVHKDGDRFLVSRIRGSSWICNALDLDLRISDRHGIVQPLIVRSLRKLTPAEAAAIPPKDLPG